MCRGDPRQSLEHLRATGVRISCGASRWRWGSSGRTTRCCWPLPPRVRRFPGTGGGPASTRSPRTSPPASWPPGGRPGGCSPSGAGQGAVSGTAWVPRAISTTMVLIQAERRWPPGRGRTLRRVRVGEGGFGGEHPRRGGRGGRFRVPGGAVSRSFRDGRRPASSRRSARSTRHQVTGGGRQPNGDGRRMDVLSDAITACAPGDRSPSSGGAACPSRKVGHVGCTGPQCLVRRVAFRTCRPERFRTRRN